MEMENHTTLCAIQLTSCTVLCVCCTMRGPSSAPHYNLNVSHPTPPDPNPHNETLYVSRSEYEFPVNSSGVSSCTIVRF